MPCAWRTLELWSPLPFLAEDQFDNKFFGISPAEAKTMDPGQRHILETSYEALFYGGFQTPARGFSGSFVVLQLGEVNMLVNFLFYWCFTLKSSCSATCCLA